MKKICTALFTLCLISSISAQIRTERSVLVFEEHQLNQLSTQVSNGKTINYASGTAAIPLQDISPFLAYSIVWYSTDWQTNDEMTIFFKNKDHTAEGQSIELEPHTTPAKGQYISQLYFTDKDFEKVRFSYQGAAQLQKVEIHLFNPGNTPESSQPVLNNQQRFACPCPQPDYFDRLGWCPDGSCPEDATPAFTSVTHLIVHHSAGANTSSDWAATVRSIYDFHVFTNGWDDIGYNWLIDPNGLIYQGRGDNVRGAHFCGNNSNTMGICMLGDYTSILPQTEAVVALEDLLAWKSCDVSIEPEGQDLHASSGQNLMHISGHRDGCATACPGDTFYPTLSTVRTAVKNIIDNECGNGLIINRPTDLDAVWSPGDKIMLSWTDNSDNEDGFTLERSINTNANYTNIATLPADATDYEDTANTSFVYFYRIRATVDSSYSNWSEEALYTPPLNTQYLVDQTTFEIFPNPSSGSSKIQLNGSYLGTIKIQVFDILGQPQTSILQHTKNSEASQYMLDLSDIVTGIYFVSITAGDKTLSRKIVRR